MSGHIYRGVDRKIFATLQDTEVVIRQRAHGIAHAQVEIFIITVIIFTA
jgi:hypothetical protein